MAELTGKIALVTGGGAGIGLATVQELGRRGAAVAVHYFRSRGGAEAAVSELSAGGGQGIAVQGDVTSMTDVRRVFDEVEERLGPIDILVNNAGDLIERRTLAEMTESLWRQVIDVNLTSTFFCCQAVAAGMTSRRTGAIVNMTSLAAHNGGGPGAFAYATAKAGIIALTKAVAMELAPHGVRVNAVSPGLIGQTQFHGRFTKPEAFDSAAKTIPLGRAGEPGEVARVIAFLAGPDASFLTGETIEINGGMFMK